jgi:hypothetical protein
MNRFLSVRTSNARTYPYSQMRSETRKILETSEEKSSLIKSDNRPMRIIKRLLTLGWVVPEPFKKVGKMFHLGC